MSADKFCITYRNDDGYAGGDRPFHVNIRADEIDEDMNETQLRALFWQSIEDNFRDSHLNLHSRQEEEFVEWAKKHIDKLAEDGQ